MLESFLLIQQVSGGEEVTDLAAGLLLLVASVAFLLYQRKVGDGLNAELEQLEGMQKNNAEYEFVLRAMKVVVWHIDCEARTIS